MVVKFEVTDLAPKIPGSSSPDLTKRPFNAALALIDGAGTPRPYLAEALPQVRTDRWSVSVDGRMETRYPLRPGLSWHDGAPLTADDFVFAYQVYTSPHLPIFEGTPQDQMETVLAPDPQTVVIRWRALYPDAGALVFGAFEPLPRHLLGERFAALQANPALRDTFVGLRFWTTEYVGTGPYRLEQWEPGSHFDGVAFAGHALGGPKIPRITIRVIADESTVLGNVLAGSVDFTADLTLKFEHAQVLKRQWAPDRGVVIMKPSGAVSLGVQLRPEYVGHPAQLDVRVRRALAHAMDRAALNDALFEGQGYGGESLVPSTVPFAAEVDRVLTKYPYDPRRSEQLMQEAGFSKDRDGFFADASGARFQTELLTNAGPEYERAQAIVADAWQRAGIAVATSVQGRAQARDLAARHTFPGLASRGGGLSERTWLSAEIGTAANRWSGENRGGWSNAEYDRLFLSFQTTLDRTERTRQVVQMLKLVSAELPALLWYFALQFNTHTGAVRGPEAGVTGFGSLTPATLPYWNLHEWALAG
jgi:peptide/nickel transport system substrate-binding protein